MPDFTIRKDDTLPLIEATLQDADGVTVDLSGATVKFQMRARGSATSKVDSAATVVAPATSGVVRYTFVAADTDTAGRYVGSFEVTFSAGVIETFPNNADIDVLVYN